MFRGTGERTIESKASRGGVGSFASVFACVHTQKSAKIMESKVRKKESFFGLLCFCDGVATNVNMHTHTLLLVTRPNSKVQKC